MALGRRLNPHWQGGILAHTHTILPCHTNELAQESLLWETLHGPRVSHVDRILASLVSKKAHHSNWYVYMNEISIFLGPLLAGECRCPRARVSCCAGPADPIWLLQYGKALFEYIYECTTPQNHVWDFKITQELALPKIRLFMQVAMGQKYLKKNNCRKNFLRFEI